MTVIDSVRSLSNAIISNDCKKYYLVTICSYNVKDIVETSSLQRVLEFLGNLNLSSGIHIYEWSEEFGKHYKQRHMHLIVGCDAFIDYKQYSNIYSFRVYWKEFPYKDMQYIRQYIRKDIILEHTEGNIYY